MPDLEFGEEWHQFCRVTVAAADHVPMVLGYLERLLEKWISASGHGNTLYNSNAIINDTSYPLQL